MTTKDKLIASAIKLFCEKGFEATSTTAICSDAGFSSGALFVHFKTKNELLDYIYLGIKKEYFEATKYKGKNDIGILETFCLGMFLGAKYYIKNAEKFVFIKRFINSPHLSRITQQEIQKELDPLFNLLDAGKKQNIIKDFPNDLLVSTLSEGYYGLIQHLIDTGQDIEKKHIQLLLDIIKKAP